MAFKVSEHVTKGLRPPIEGNTLRTKLLQWFPDRASRSKPIGVVALDVESVSQSLDRGLIGVGMLAYNIDDDAFEMAMHQKIAETPGDADSTTEQFWMRTPELQKTLAWYRTNPDSADYVRAWFHIYFRELRTRYARTEGVTDNGPYDFPAVTAFMNKSDEDRIASVRHEINSGRTYTAITDIRNVRLGYWAALESVDSDLAASLRNRHDAFVDQLTGAFMAHCANMTESVDDPCKKHTALYDATRILASYVFFLGE